MADCPRSRRAQGASTLSSEIKISAGFEPRDLIGQLGPQEAGQREPAGRELDPGQPELRALIDHRRQVIGRLGIEQLVVGQGSRRDDSDDVALDQPLGDARVFDLLADRRAQAGLDDLCQVGFQGRVRESPPSAPHRRPCRARSAPSREGRGPFGVVAEHLVEIAHPKQQEGIRIAGLQLAILLHHRCQRLVHGST